MSEWEKLAERFSLIPLVGKAPIEPGWQQWCERKRLFSAKDFCGKNAGVACGPASGVIVIDIDSDKLFRQLLESKGWTYEPTLTVRTGADRYHLYFAYPQNGTRYGCTSYKMNVLGQTVTVFDVRGIGGQVVGPASIHPTTKKAYRIVRDIPPAPAPTWLLDLISEKKSLPKDGKVAASPGWTGTIDDLPISAEVKDYIRNGGNTGDRSEKIMSVCNALVWSNLTDSEIVSIFDSYPIGEKYREKRRAKDRWLEKHIEKARNYVEDRADPSSKTLNVHIPKTSFEDCQKDIKSVTRCNLGNLGNQGGVSVTSVTSCNQLVTRTEKVVTGNPQIVTGNTNEIDLPMAVKGWMELVDGVFTLRDIADELFYRVSPPLIPPLKNYLKLILFRMCEKREIERVGSARGTYRKIDQNLEESQWWEADTEEYPILLPLGLTDLLKVFPKNVIVIAGEKSAAKSAFALNVALLNIPNLQCRYFNSEGGPEEYKNRLMNFEEVPLDFWRKMPMYEKSQNVEDYIFPDDLNIVDYLEIHKDYFLVGLMIKKIYDRLNRGVALINLQKDPNCDLGRGNTMSIEKARLYVSLSVCKDDRGMIYNKATIVDAKTPRDRNRHPRGMEKTFRIHNGATFYELADWQHKKGK